MKKIILRLISHFLFVSTIFMLASCSSSQVAQNTLENPSSLKKQSVLTKEYPGIFSVADSYIHLPLDEKERDQIIFPCSNGKVTETIKKLFNDIKDQTRIYINNYYAGTCYAINKDFNRALHYFGKVYSSAPDNSLKSKALANMGVLQWRWGKYRKALAYLRESYIMQKNPVTLYLLTSLELELGLFQKALTQRDEMLKYSFTDPWWKLVIAESSFFSSDYDKAVVMYESLPNDFWENQSAALTNYVVSLYKTGRHEVAKNFVNKWKSQLLTIPSYQTAKKILPEIAKYE